MTDLQKQLKELADKRLSIIMAQRTEILEAFIAKHGYHPEEVEQVIQNLDNGDQLYFVRKRVNTTTLHCNKIIAAVCEAYNIVSDGSVQPEDVMGKSRLASVIMVRHMVIYILRKHYGHKLEAIGLTMGGMNHASMIHAYKQTERRMGPGEVTTALYRTTCEQLNIEQLV